MALYASTVPEEESKMGHGHSLYWQVLGLVAAYPFVDCGGFFPPDEYPLPASLLLIRLTAAVSGLVSVGTCGVKSKMISGSTLSGAESTISLARSWPGMQLRARPPGGC